MRFIRTILWFFWRGIRGLLPSSIRERLRRCIRHPLIAWMFGIPRQPVPAAAVVPALGLSSEHTDFGGSPLYNIDLLRRTRPVGGIAIIMHVGMGDYLMASPMFEALRQAHPDLPIRAYVSDSTDNVASALVVHLARNNPVFQSVHTFSGRPRDYWKEYDIADALGKIPEDFAALRLVYDTEPQVWHRTTTLFQTFGLPVYPPVPRPFVRPVPLSENAATLLRSIRELAGEKPARIVLCHLDTRSSEYMYPYVDDLLSRLLNTGYTVLTLTATGLTDPKLVPIDVSRLTPNDTIELLRALRDDGHILGILSVNSVVAIFSACLNIPNLCLQLFRDESCHHYHYPNIRVVTQYVYPRLSPHQIVWARSPADYVERPSRLTGKITDYMPQFVVDQFLAMMRDVEGYRGLGGN